MTGRDGEGAATAEVRNLDHPPGKQSARHADHAYDDLLKRATS
jgi:hypothetical protein